MASPSLAQVQERLGAPGLTAADVFACAQDLAQLAGEARPRGERVRRIALAGDATLDFVQRAVACALALEGELADFHVAPAGTRRQACMDTGSALLAFAPDAVLLAPEARACLEPLAIDAPADAVAGGLAAQVREHEALWTALAAHGCLILQHTLVPPPHHWRGPADRLLAADPQRRVAALNDALLQAGAQRVAWVELDRLAQDAGLAAWAPERFRHAGNLPFDPRFLPAYIPWFRTAWRAATGRTRKVLALDLDDTLWGGVIGDDGPEGIVLGPGTPAGEAFAAWQAHLASLARRGVVLAVCSKNDAAVAAAGLAHPGSVLRREDFAAFACSWDDKAQGLRQVARELGVGLDAIIFADDNPAECALVRQLLPEVAVVPLGADASQFAARLGEGHWFDMATYTPEDFQRTASYAAHAQARVERTAAPDLASYLQGLAMHGSMRRAVAADLPRLAQMELKTNQFNVATRRLPRDTLAQWLAQEGRHVYVFSLRDRFADHGLAGSLAVVHEADAWRIDNWLLSCRVFARTCEHFMLAHVAAAARAAGVRELVGEYRESPRNAVVADLYARLGFRQDTQGTWRLDLAVPAADPASFITPAA